MNRSSKRTKTFPTTTKSSTNEKSGGRVAPACFICYTLSMSDKKDLNPNKEKEKLEAKKAGKLYTPVLWVPKTPPSPDYDIERGIAASEGQD